MVTAIAIRPEDPRDGVTDVNGPSCTEVIPMKNQVAGQTVHGNHRRTLTIHRRFESAFTQLASYW